MVSILEKANPWVRVRGAEKSFAMRKRENFPEVRGTGSAWLVDLPIPTVLRHSLQYRSEELHIDRTFFSGQEDREEHPRSPERLHR